MKLFNKFNCRIIKVIKSYIFTHFDKETEKNKIIETFKTFDENNDGIINREELKKGLLKLIPSNNIKVIDELINNIMEKADTNNNGVIEFSEFLTASIEINNFLKTNKNTTIFNLLDIDKDGKITKSDIKTILKDIKLTDSMWKSFVEEYNIEDNNISKENFNKFLNDI